MKGKKKLFISVFCLCIILANVVFAGTNYKDMPNIPKEMYDYVEEQYYSLSLEEKERLVSELYSEKYSEYVSVQCAEAYSLEEETDIAYQNMVENEQYIVDIISEHSGENADVANWEYNLQYLKENYEALSSVEQIDMEQIDWYIEDYDILLNEDSNSASQINMVRTASSSYDFKAAVTYAETYALSYNTSYPDWTDYGGDCANFVSQCLYAGGKSMCGVPGLSSSAQSTSSWFSYWTANSTTYVSSTWRGANAFMTYWKNNASAWKKFDDTCAESWSYGYKGDAVSLLNSNGRAYHTLIIVGYEGANYDFVVAAHTNDTKTSMLSYYADIAPGGFVIYNMR